MANKPGIKLLFVAAVAAVGYFGISFYLRPMASVVEVRGGDVAKAVSAQIRVRAETALEIKIESGGRMKNELKEGQTVRENDTLIEVDTKDKEFAIAGQKQELKTARERNNINEKLAANRLKNAQRDLELKRLDKEAKRLSQLDFDRAESLVSDLELNQGLEKVMADDAVARKELEIQRAELELSRMTFQAPFAGSLTDIKFPKGSLIGQGQTVATLINNTRVVEARISEENMSKGVREGQHVRVRFTGLETDFTGTIETILPAQDAQTLRYIAHLKLDIDPKLLGKTGQSGDGVITIDTHVAKVRVPRRALFNGQLYVVRDGVVEVRTPKTGYDSGGVVEILSGLQVGESVIVDHQELFKDGQRVRTVKELSEEKVPAAAK